ncbi:Retrovirus-related Pol polyprotein from type-1 retrotransposable element R1 (Fragment) [Anthophora quadrimaculata]
MQNAKIVTDEIKQRAVNHVDIIAAQEPYSYRNTVPGFGLVSKAIFDTKKFTGLPATGNIKAAIFVINPTYTVMRLEHLSNTHFACAEITTASQKLYVVSAYFQCSDSISRYLQHLEYIAHELRGRKVIFCIDANAKSTLWHSDITDERGEALEELIVQNNLYLVNRLSEHHTFDNLRGKSNIDITLTTTTLFNEIVDWTVLTNATTSDHNTITITIDSDSHYTENYKPRMTRYNIKKVDWNKFESTLAAELNTTNTPAENDHTINLETLAENLTRALTTASDAAIPRKTRFAKSVPWWNEKLTALKKEVQQMRRQVQRTTGTVQYLDIKAHYNRTRNRYRATVRTTKLNNWRDFVTKEGNANPWSLIYKLQTEKIRTEKAFDSIKSNGTHALNWEESVTILLDTLVPDDTTDNETAVQKRIRETSRTPPDTDNALPFSTDEIENVIKKLKNKKAPGDDLIENEILKIAWTHIKGPLTYLYNQCLSQGIFPDCWKRSNIITLLKGKNKDKTNPRSYRPICLLPTLSKVLEKIINERILSILHQHPQTAERQFGFKSGKSTEDAVVTLRKIVTETKDRYAVAVFFDVTGAFDNVWWLSILHNLKNRSCPRNIYQLLQSYLSNRTAVIVSAHGKIEKDVSKGCPQGSILGPGLWNLIFDELIQRVTQHNFEPIAYADDLAIIITGNSRLELQDKANRAVGVVSGWCAEQKLQISKTKTEMLLLKGFLDIKRPPTVKIENKSIRMAQTVKYLGVHFGTRFNIAHHTRYIADKCKTIFNNIAQMARAHWGLHRGTTSILYKGVFLPILTYAAAGWQDKISGWHVKTLTQAQRHVLLRTTKAFRTISTDALMVIAGAIPADLAILQSKLRYDLRKNNNFSIGNLAFQAREQPPDIQETRSIRAKITSEILQIWQQRWDSSNKGGITHLYMNNITKRIESTWIWLNFYNIQLLSGHGQIRDKQAALSITPTNTGGKHKAPPNNSKRKPRQQRAAPEDKNPQEARVQNRQRQEHPPQKTPWPGGHGAQRRGTTRKELDRTTTRKKKRRSKKT